MGFDDVTNHPYIHPKKIPYFKNNLTAPLQSIFKITVYQNALYNLQNQEVKKVIIKIDN